MSKAKKANNAVMGVIAAIAGGTFSSMGWLISTGDDVTWEQGEHSDWKANFTYRNEFYRLDYTKAAEIEEMKKDPSTTLAAVRLAEMTVDKERRELVNAILLDKELTENDTWEVLRYSPVTRNILSGEAARLLNECRAETGAGGETQDALAAKVLSCANDKNAKEFVYSLTGGAAGAGALFWAFSGIASRRRKDAAPQPAPVQAVAEEPLPPKKDKPAFKLD